MNTVETIAFKWLSQKYSSSKVKFQGKSVPSFVCSDGSKYVVKKLYKNKLIFYRDQQESLDKENPQVIMIGQNNQVVGTFWWAERADKKKNAYSCYFMNRKGGKKIKIDRLPEVLSTARRENKTLSELVNEALAQRLKTIEVKILFLKEDWEEFKKFVQDNGGSLSPEGYIVERVKEMVEERRVSK